MKACVDCKFFQPAAHPFRISHARCGHPNHLDPVTGFRGKQFAEMARSRPLTYPALDPEGTIGFCGPEGRLWQPKPVEPRSWLQQLFGW